MAFYVITMLVHFQKTKVSKQRRTWWCRCREMVFQANGLGSRPANFFRMPYFTSNRGSCSTLSYRSHLPVIIIIIVTIISVQYVFLSSSLKSYHNPGKCADARKVKYYGPIWKETLQ